LHRFDWTVPAMEIGYWLRPDAEGKGYVSEMVKLITAFAFTHLMAERVEIRCDAVNKRSAAVPRRLGFKQEALLRGSRRNIDGVLGDTLVFAMIRTDHVE
jgi:RimJ/RimL family protein N-acetyltransferase